MNFKVPFLIAVLIDADLVTSDNELETKNEIVGHQFFLEKPEETNHLGDLTANRSL